MKFIRLLIFIPIFSVVFSIQAASPSPTTPQLAPPLDDVLIYSGTAITMGADTIINGNDNTHSIEATTLGAGAELGGNIVAGANITLGASARALGDVKAGGGVTLGGDARVGGYIWSGDFTTLGATSIAGSNAGYIMVEGNVNAGGPVILGAQSIVNGNVTSGAYGSIDLRNSTEVGGYAKAGIGLTLGMDTTVGFNSEPNSDYGLAGSGPIKLDLRAKLKGNATAGSSITLGASATIDGTQIEYTPTTLVDNDPEPIHNARAELTELQATLSEHVAPIENELLASQTSDRTFLAGVYHAADFTTTAGITITFDGENKEGHWLINADTYIAFGAGIKMKYTRMAPNSTITWNSKGYISIGAGTPLERSEVLGTFFASQYISTGAQVQLKGLDNRCGGLYATNGYVTLGATNTMGLIGCKAGPTPTGPAYFKVSHDTKGIHCAAEPISVSARNADDSITTGFSGIITLDTQTGTGGWSLDSGKGTLIDNTDDDGLATYTFNTADNGMAEFLLYYSEGNHTFDIDAYEGSLRDNDAEGNMTFSASGFTITASEFNDITTKTAGDDFTIFISAFGTKAKDGTCGIIETYDQANKDLTLTTAYSNPISGTVLAKSSDAIMFNNGQATVSIKYQDVGEIGFRFTDGNLVGSSNNFVVKPDSFKITLNGSYEATNANGTVYTKAGVNFDMKVTAKGSDGVTTPNYGNEKLSETVNLNHTLAQPVDGNNGIFNSNLGTPDNGIYSGTASWSEVGIINLTASIGDAEYLGAGNVSTILNNVGRFTPATLSITSINNGSFISTNKKSAPYFTYVGQEFSYDPNQRPSFKVTAMNALPSPTTTLNYTGDWGKLSADSIAFISPSSDSSQDGKTASTLMVLIYSRDTAGFRNDDNPANLPKAVNGIFNVTFTNDDFTYEKNHNSEISPFKPSVNLVITNVEDLDGISTGTLTLNPIGTDEIRFGRMEMIGSNDSSETTLTMNYKLQYLNDDGSFNLHNDQDSIVFKSQITGEPTGISVSELESTSTEGKFKFTLTRQADSSAKKYKMTTNLRDAGLPWLQYDWDSDSNFDDDPFADAAFGNNNGETKSIYIKQKISE